MANSFAPTGLFSEVAPNPITPMNSIKKFFFSSFVFIPKVLEFLINSSAKLVQKIALNFILIKECWIKTVILLNISISESNTRDDH